MVVLWALLSGALSMVHVGDWGRGLPLRAEISVCQDVSGGEMIWSPVSDVWSCEL